MGWVGGDRPARASGIISSKPTSLAGWSRSTTRLPGLSSTVNLCGLPFLGDFEPGGRHLQKDCSLALGLRALRPAEMLVGILIELFGW
jgi:hypothetical protein